MAEHVSDYKKEVRTYINVFLTLMVLTVVTVAVSYVPMALPLTIAVALIIAFVKGSLVASFFMHLIHEKPIVFASLVLTVVFFLAMILLPLLAHWDRLGG